MSEYRKAMDELALSPESKDTIIRMMIDEADKLDNGYAHGMDGISLTDDAKRRIAAAAVAAEKRAARRRGIITRVSAMAACVAVCAVSIPGMMRLRQFEEKPIQPQPTATATERAIDVTAPPQATVSDGWEENREDRTGTTVSGGSDWREYEPETVAEPDFGGRAEERAAARKAAEEHALKALTRPDATYKPTTDGTDSQVYIIESQDTVAQHPVSEEQPMQTSVANSYTTRGEGVSLPTAEPSADEAVSGALDSVIPTEPPENDTSVDCSPIFAEYDGVKRLDEALGYTVPIPEYMPNGYETERTEIVAGIIAQVTYVNGESSILYRAAREQGDISGDYNIYKSVREIKVNDIAVTLKSDDSVGTQVIWQDGEMSYSVFSDTVLSVEDVTTIVKSVRT